MAGVSFYIPYSPVVRALHRAMLEGWIRRDAAAYAAPLADDALVVVLDRRA